MPLVRYKISLTFNALKAMVVMEHHANALCIWKSCFDTGRRPTECKLGQSISTQHLINTNIHCPLSLLVWQCPAYKHENIIEWTFACYGPHCVMMHLLVNKWTGSAVFCFCKVFSQGKFRYVWGTLQIVMDIVFYNTFGFCIGSVWYLGHEADPYALGW